MPMQNKLRDIVRALRLPFLSASILPFIAGSLLAKGQVNYLVFFLGLALVACTHLSANLINDYADSKSGVDWKDENFYNFFGGSKLIQEGVFSEKFYLFAAIAFFLLSVVLLIFLSVVLSSISVIGFYVCIIILAWSYSVKPLQLSYKRIGEVVIFLLFGPVLVMGGYFLQTKIFPDSRGFMVSLPFGLLTTAILFVNEVPDFPEDKSGNKLNWVSLTGPSRAFYLYLGLIFLALLAIIIGIKSGYFGKIALFSFLGLVPAMKAVNILKAHYDNKKMLVESSKLTIAIQNLTGVILILAILL
jgi:1,4-dihydroxy-2-naphthoate octaprenyltransferase